MAPLYGYFSPPFATYNQFVKDSLDHGDILLLIKILHHPGLASTWNSCLNQSFLWWLHSDTFPLQPFPTHLPVGFQSSPVSKNPSFSLFYVFIYLSVVSVNSWNCNFSVVSNSLLHYFVLKLFHSWLLGAPSGWLVILVFFFKIFWCGPFLKSLLNLLQYCFCFMFWCFWPWGMWDLSSPTRDRTRAPCIGRRSFNRLTAKEVLGLSSLWCTCHFWAPPLAHSRMFQVHLVSSIPHA